MFFWNSLAFPITQWMSAVWSLVPLPFLNSAWTSESSFDCLPDILPRRAFMHAKPVQLYRIMCYPIAHKGPLSMGLSSQEYSNGLLCLLQGIFPAQGWNPHLLHLIYLRAGSLPLVHLGSPLPRQFWNKHITEYWPSFYSRIPKINSEAY